MIGKKLPAVFWIVFAIWVILQVCLVVKYWDMPNHDDARFYAKYATECIAEDVLGFQCAQWSHSYS